MHADNRIYVANWPFGISEEYIRSEMNRIVDELHRLHKRDAGQPKAIPTIIQIPRDRRYCECGHELIQHPVIGNRGGHHDIYGECSEPGCTCTNGIGRFRGFCFVKFILPDYLTLQGLVNYMVGRRFGMSKEGRVMHVEIADPKGTPRAARAEVSTKLRDM